MDQDGCTQTDEYTKKLSFEFTSLESKTKYSFRVCAVSNKGVEGEWCDRIQGETRHGIALTVLKTAAEIGKGTVMAPYKGGKKAGDICNELAADKTDSTKLAAKAGGATVGAVVGLIASPVLGIARGVKKYKKYTGKLEKVSPQTSSDEDNK